MADIVLKNGWKEKAIYKNVTSVSFETTTEGVRATYYENGNGGTGLSVQADWEQNDSTAQDYIKNRPFYSYFPPIIPPVNTSIENKTFQGLALYGATLNDVPALTAEYYVVYWNDTGWRCRLTTSGEGVIYLGTYSILRGEAGENGEPPFCGVYSADSNSITLYALKEGGFPVGLLEGEEVVKKIDDKYLPDTALSGGANWDAEPGQDGYIENKPTDLANEKFVQDEIAKVQQNVQSDWNAVEPSLAAIKNKPTNLATTKYVGDEIKKVTDSLQDYAKSSELEELETDVQNVEKTLETGLENADKALKQSVKEINQKFTDTQANWDIEDETNLAAIKNKPFGVYPDFLNGTYQPSDFVETIDENNLVTYELRSGKTLTSSQTCIVIWNGTTYTCTPGANVSSREFQLSLDGAIVLPTKPTAPKTVVLRLVDNIYRIDKKFLPTSEIVAGYATQTYVDNKVSSVPQPDWNATTGKGAILNKPEIKTPVQADWSTKNSSDLSFIKNKPTIPAAQVNSDWTATSGKAMILNKPTIPDPQVQADWAQTDSEKIDFIKNKPDHFADWSQIDPNAPDFVRGKPQFFSDWNATTGTNRIENMPTAFRHTQKEVGAEEFVVDTATGWERRPVNKLTMTVTFEDESVKIYSILGQEVVE